MITRETAGQDAVTDIKPRGARGIGLETTIYLAKQGATVYVAARDSEVTKNGIEEARKQVGQALNKNGAEVESRIKYHILDQGSVATAWQSAEAFRKIESRLDILILNAGVAMTNMSELSPDGYDLMFATNHLGAFAFTTGLLGTAPFLKLSHVSIFCFGANFVGSFRSRQENRR